MRLAAAVAATLVLVACSKGNEPRSPSTSTTTPIQAAARGAAVPPSTREAASGAPPNETPIAAPTPSSLPALENPDCVTPELDTRRRDPTEPPEVYAKTPAYDFDGDGVTDVALALAALCGNVNCTWHLYVTRGACARHVGTVMGDFRIGKQGPVGYRELHVIEHGGGCGAHGESLLRFDGQAYRAVKGRHCPCATEGAPPEVETCGPWRQPSPASRSLSRP
jgi:hypothetical protein